MTTKRTSEVASRYLFAGMVNTALSYTLYAIFVQFVQPVVAYLLSWFMCLGSAFLLQSRLVFKASMPARRTPLFLLSYVIQLMAGTLAIHGLTLAGASALIAGVGAMIVTVPLGFVISRWLFAAPASHTDPTHE